MNLCFEIDDALCTRCRECVKDCPGRVIVQEGNAVPEIPADNAGNCIGCQHCLAICPTGALSILGKHPSGSLELAGAKLPSADETDMLVRSRRSVRRFKPENVERSLVGRLLAATAHAPNGANRAALGFTLIDNRERMKAIRSEVLGKLREAAEAGRIPEQMGYLHTAVPAFFKYRADLIFRGAPHLLLVSTDEKALTPAEDIAIALTTFELLAATAGLGTVWCGMLKMALETVPELKPLFGLTPDQPYYAMLFGIPAVKYARTVQRDESATVKSL